MKELDFPIERLNSFFDKYIFEVYGLDENGIDTSNIPLNIKIQITGIKEYISLGKETPFIEYTLYVLPHKEYSNVYYQVLRKHFGRETDINTRSDQYQDIRWVMNEKLSRMLKYFSIDMPAICKKVINEIEPFKLNENLIVESLIKEDKYDSIVRQVVRDIFMLFKNKEQGRFYLPPDVHNDQELYFFGDSISFNVELELIPDDSVDGYDIESNFYRDEDVMDIAIVYNPQYGKSVLYSLIGDLNDNVRHELQHSIQHSQEYKFPKKEPKSPLKYYTQPHEIEAQKKGFKRVAKLQRKPLEQVVRNWFSSHRSRHGLNDKEIEMVVNQILK